MRTLLQNETYRENTKIIRELSWREACELTATETNTIGVINILHMEMPVKEKMVSYFRCITEDNSFQRGVIKQKLISGDAEISDFEDYSGIAGAATGACHELLEEGFVLAQQARHLGAVSTTSSIKGKTHSKTGWLFEASLGLSKKAKESFINHETDYYFTLRLQHDDVPEYGDYYEVLANKKKYSGGRLDLNKDTIMDIQWRPASDIIKFILPTQYIFAMRALEVIIAKGGREKFEELSWIANDLARLIYTTKKSSPKELV